MDDTTDAVPKPGSEEARALGCECPVIDNHYGEGVPHSTGRRFWISGNCPVHAKRSETNAP